MVEIITSSKKIRVYKQPNGISDDEKSSYTINIFESEFENIFIGKDPLDSWGDGNCILVHVKNFTYISIGESIYEFQSKDKIIRFESPVGNNDVPYPWAADNSDNVYLLLEKKVIQMMKFMIDEFNPKYSSSLIGIKYKHLPKEEKMIKILEFYSDLQIMKKFGKIIDPYDYWYFHLPKNIKKNEEYNMNVTYIIHKRI